MGKERLAEEAQKDIFKSPFIQHMEAIEIRRTISIRFGVFCLLDFLRNEEERKVNFSHYRRSGRLVAGQEPLVQIDYRMLLSISFVISKEYPTF